MPRECRKYLYRLIRLASVSNGNFGGNHVVLGFVKCRLNVNFKRLQMSPFGPSAPNLNGELRIDFQTADVHRTDSPTVLVCVSTSDTGCGHLRVNDFVCIRIILW